MGISATRTKVYSLQTKGFVQIVDSTHSGLRVKPILPWDHPDIKRREEISEASTPLEEFDFYSDPALRRAIRERENNRCFYSFQKITDENFVLEHIISRPQGNNSYMNIVATTKSMNNKNGNMKADDFLRLLYRDGLLSESELTDRLQALEQLTRRRVEAKSQRLTRQIQPTLKSGAADLRRYVSLSIHNHD